MKRIIFVIFVMFIAIYSYALQILAEDFAPIITYTTTSGLSAVAPSTIENDYVNVIWQTQKGEGGARFTYNATKDGYVKVYINYDCAHTLSDLYFRITSATFTRDFTLIGHGNGNWGRYFEESTYLAVKQGDNVVTISSLQNSGDWNTRIKSIKVSQVLNNAYYPVDENLYRDVYADTWVGADSLGRQMPTNEQVGDPNDRKVGIFYFLWHEGNADDGTSSYGLFDNTAAYLSGGKGQGGVAALRAQMVKGALGYAHYWAEPYFGYYRSNDEWVIRKHAYQLSNMGVDFIYMDNTNGIFYMSTLKTVFETFRKIRTEGGKTPQICLFLGGDSAESFYNQLPVIYNEIYELNLYSDLWFMWDGKPLMLGNKEWFDKKADLAFVKYLGWKRSSDGRDYSQTQFNNNYENVKTRITAKVAEIQSKKYMLDKFTVKRSWAFENGAAYQATQGQDTWLWADTFPQAIGYNSDKTFNDQMVVMSGFWANGNGGRSNFSLNPTQAQKQTKNVDGKTVTIKEFTSTRPLVNDFEFSLVENGTSGQGLAYQEHWGRALETNPKVAMVTGWNEWWAGRWDLSDGIGQTIANTYKVVASDPIYKNYYVDCFNPEFSRDCEPMKNKDGLGFGDNYMYQTAMNIRHYKGVRPIPTATNQKAITINTNFTQWDDVGPEYRDTIGDITQRSGDISFGYMFNYENKSGRYDIEKAKVSIYNDKAYFYVKTVNNITLFTSDVGLMNLFIDSDQNPKTGWNGYDLLVNNSRTSISADVKKWNGTSWAKVESAPYKLSGNQMHLSMSASLLNQTGFDFKWCDNSVNSAKADGGYYDDPMNFMDRGDAAPDDRYNYRYKPNSLGEKTFVENFDNLLSYPNWQGINKSFLKVDLFQQKLVATESHLEGIGTTKKYGEGNVISYKLKSWVEDTGRHMSGFVCLRMPVLQRVWEGDNGVRIAVRANQIHITAGNVIYGDLDFITIDIPDDYSNEFKQVYLYDLGDQIVIFGENNVKFAEIEILANEIIVKDANNVEKGRRTVTLPSEGYVTIGSHLGKMEISQFTIGKVEKQQNKFSFSKNGLNLDKLETGTITAKSIQTNNTLICAQFSSLNELKKILIVNPNQAKEANFDVLNGDYFKTMQWDFGNYKPISELETMSFIGKR